MAKDNEKESPDPQWADGLQPDQQSEEVAEEQTEPLSPEQGPSEA